MNVPHQQVANKINTVNTSDISSINHYMCIHFSYIFSFFFVFLIFVVLHKYFIVLTVGLEETYV